VHSHGNTRRTGESPPSLVITNEDDDDDCAVAAVPRHRLSTTTTTCMSPWPRLATLPITNSIIANNHHPRNAHVAAATFTAPCHVTAAVIVASPAT